MAGFPAAGSGTLKVAFGGNEHQRLDATFDAAGFSSAVIGADSLTLAVTLDDVFDAPKIKVRLKAVDGDISNRHFDQLTGTADGSLKKIDVALQAKGTRLPQLTLIWAARPASTARLKSL